MNPAGRSDKANTKTAHLGRLARDRKFSTCRHPTGYENTPPPPPVQLDHLHVLDSESASTQSQKWGWFLLPPSRFHHKFMMNKTTFHTRTKGNVDGEMWMQWRPQEGRKAPARMLHVPEDPRVPNRWSWHLRRLQCITYRPNGQTF